jgi:hypothetical protein
MKTMLAMLALAIGVGMTVVACGATPPEQGGEQGREAEPALQEQGGTCGLGYVYSCYNGDPNNCHCCPKSKPTWDCPGPGSTGCYCCYENTCG